MTTPCPFQETLDLISRRHALSIVWFLAKHGPARFTGIKRELTVNQVTLSERLGELERAGIITRTAYSEIPPRVEYELAPPGRELLPLFDMLDKWAERHEAGVLGALATPGSPRGST